MVIVLPAAPRKPSKGELIGQALNNALSMGLQSYLKHQNDKQLEQGLDQAQQLFSDPNLTAEQKQIGLFKALRGSPDLAKVMGQQLAGLQTQSQKSYSDRLKGEQDLAFDQQRYDVIKKNFGERAAELFKSAPEGGKTSIINSLLESKQRGLDVDELLGQPYENPQPSDFMRNQTERPSIKAIDYDRGLTPKERVRRQEDRYGKNLPLYQETQKKMQGLEYEKDSLNTLAELSPKIGALQRLNINPENGELIIPALASPEAQRFVKTVNDFTVKAKDSYGSRVSNFELDRFMKRLPTLANSEEGRNQIIKQMKIINDINTAKEKSLQDVIDEHGGIRNIDYDKAERMADKQSKGQIEALKKEFKSIDESLDRQYQKKIKDKKKALVPPGRVAIEKDGKIFSIPSKQLKIAMKKGYKQV